MTRKSTTRIGRSMAIVVALAALAAGAPSVAVGACASGTHFPDGTIVSR
jgi:hypothetical protein